MGNKQHDTTQTTGSTPRGSSQVGTHGQTNDSNDREHRDMQQGDETRPASPSGTSPLDKDQQPVNQNRPVQQNR